MDGEVEAPLLLGPGRAPPVAAEQGGRLGVRRLDRPGQQGPVGVPAGRRLGVVAVGPGDHGHVELAPADGQGGGVDQRLGVVAARRGDQDLRRARCPAPRPGGRPGRRSASSTGWPPAATRSGRGGTVRPAPAPPGEAPSQSSTAAWTASNMRPSGSGRSASEPSPSVWGRLVTWPTPTTTGVAGSIVIVASSLPVARNGSIPARSDPHARYTRSMRIAVGSDHAGYALKSETIARLTGAGHEVLDLGTDSAEVSVDYPLFGRAVGEAVAEGRAERGVCVCGTGIGIGMAANKVRGVRAAVVHDSTTALLARQPQRRQRAVPGGADHGAGRGHGRRRRLPRHRVRRRAPPAAHRADHRPGKAADPMSAPVSGSPFDPWLTDDPEVRSPPRRRGRSPVHHAPADRLGELHLDRGAGRHRLGAHQQVRRGLPGPALLRRQPGHRRGRGPGPRPLEGAVRCRARQRAAPRRLECQSGRLPGAPPAG